MPRDRVMADVLQELYEARQTGAYFITVKESSKDLFKLYIKDGDAKTPEQGGRAAGRGVR